MILTALLAFSMLPARALLIAIDQPGYQVPDKDCALIEMALLRRQWSPGNIQIVQPRNGDELKQILRSFPGGLVYVSGNGTTGGLTPTLDFGPTQIPWRSILPELLDKPILLLPDTGYTNLLFPDIPTGVSAILSSGNWRAINQPRVEGDFVRNGDEGTASVLAFALYRELPFATDVSDLAFRITKYQASASMAALWSDLYTVQVVGSGLPKIPGQPLDD